MTNPGPLRVRNLRVGSTETVTSCAADHCKRSRAMTIQTAKTGEEVREKEVSRRKNPTRDASQHPESTYACGDHFRAISLAVDNGDHCSFSTFCCSTGVSSVAFIL